MKIQLELPWPPSVNNYWKPHVLKKGRRYIPTMLVTKQGRAYRTAVQRHCEDLGMNDLKLSQRLCVVIDACPPDRRRRDVDNMLKLALDGVTHAKIWGDDCQIDDLRIVRGPVEPGGVMRVFVEEMG